MRNSPPAALCEPAVPAGFGAGLEAVVLVGLSSVPPGRPARQVRSNRDWLLPAALPGVSFIAPGTGWHPLHAFSPSSDLLVIVQPGHRLVHPVTELDGVPALPMRWSATARANRLVAQAREVLRRSGCLPTLRASLGALWMLSTQPRTAPMAVLRRAGRLSGRDVRAAEAATADLQHDGWTVLADTVVPVPLPADSAADLRELASDLGLSLADMDQLLGIGPAAFGGLVSVAWSWRLVVAERRSA